MSALKTLIDLSHKLGRDPLLVQAGGGNISVKSNDQEMVIKASGIRLGSVDAKRGWAVARYRDIAHELPKLFRLHSVTQRELSYAELLTRSGRTPGWRVSMEAGFHAIIDHLCIVHLHSIAAVLLGMMPQPQANKWIAEALGRPLVPRFVPASIPGLELTQYMARELARSARPGDLNLWIQRNHGLVWTADGASEIIKASRRMEKNLRARLGLDRYTLPHTVGARGCKRKPSASPRNVADQFWTELCFCNWPACQFDMKPLFPDFGIYFDLWNPKNPADLVKSSERSVWMRSKDKAHFENRREVLFAHALVHTVARRRGWLKAVSVKMIQAIKGLETERLRLAQAASR
jgi:ribulose-5-phosphate 4-epimerase/fuculose-1-phosphate aldolase